MKSKNKLLLLGTLASVAVPIAAVVSCGTDSKTNTTNGGAGSVGMADLINGAPDMYQTQYDYQSFLKNDQSGFDTSTGTLTLDFAALHKFATSYPIDSNSFNEDRYSEIARESVRKELRDKGFSGQNLENEMKKVATTSAPLTLQTDSVYYSYFDSTTPDSNGDSSSLTAGFYHIRPESTTDILAIGGADWNRIAVNNDPFINKLKTLTTTTGNKDLKPGDQLIFNTAVTDERTTTPSASTYTYYERYDDKNGGGSLTEPGFFLGQPTSKDGAGVVSEAGWFGDMERYNFSAIANRLDLSTINPGKDKDGNVVPGKYTIDIYKTDMGIAGNTFAKQTKTFFTNTDAPAIKDFKHSFGNDLKWDGTSPISFRHFLSPNHQIVKFDKSDLSAIQNAFTIDKKHKDILQYLQPDTKWIAPGSAGSLSFGSVTFTPDVSTLSYNDKTYKLSSYLTRGDNTMKISSLYNPEDFKFLDTDSLHWKDVSTKAKTSIPSALQPLLLTGGDGHLDGYEKILKGYLNGKTYTLYTTFADDAPMPDELQGFYLTQPTDVASAQKAIFQTDPTKTNEIDGAALEAFPYNIAKVDTSVKIQVDVPGSTKANYVDAKYWNPSNLGDLRVELLYSAAADFKTKAGFTLTTMITKEQGWGATTILTQQDRGFSPETNPGSWESTLASETSGAEDNLFKYADFIEVQGTNDYYYNHYFFNYDGAKKLDLLGMTETEREKYRMPAILQGFYKNDTKLDYAEYIKEKDDYIDKSLNSGSTHDKLIFNGLNGSKSVTTYKGVIYKNKTINGMIAHTSWSPFAKNGVAIVYGEKQSQDDWKSQDGLTTYPKPDDYFSLKDAFFQDNIYTFKDTTGIQEMAKEVTYTPFDGLKDININWGNETLGTIHDISAADFKILMSDLKSNLVFSGTINTIINNLAYSEKDNLGAAVKKHMADELFGKTEKDYEHSIFKKLAEKLRVYTVLKGGN